MLRLPVFQTASVPPHRPRTLAEWRTGGLDYAATAELLVATARDDPLPSGSTIDIVSQSTGRFAVRSVRLTVKNTGGVSLTLGPAVFATPPGVDCRLIDQTTGMAMVTSL